MSPGPCAPVSPSAQWIETSRKSLPVGSRYLSASSTRSHCQPPEVPCHGPAIQGIREMWGPLLALAESTVTSSTPPQGQAARWLRSGGYQMCLGSLIPLRPGGAGKGPFTCSQALIGSWAPKPALVPRKIGTHGCEV